MEEIDCNCCSACAPEECAQLAWARGMGGGKGHCPRLSHASVALGLILLSALSPPSLPPVACLRWPGVCAPPSWRLVCAPNGDRVTACASRSNRVIVIHDARVVDMTWPIRLCCNGHRTATLSDVLCMTLWHQLVAAREWAGSRPGTQRHGLGESRSLAPWWSWSCRAVPCEAGPTSTAMLAHT